jgi:hypothetical protein
MGDGLDRYVLSRDSGDLANEVLDENGQLIKRSAGYQFQDGKLSFPNFKEVKDAVRDLNLFRRTYGNIDDFVGAVYTDKIFKPLAVMSMGFGVRDALSETLPGMFQHGGFNMLRGMVASVAKKNAFKS